MDNLPQLTQEQRERLSEIIYGYFKNDLKFSDEVASGISVNFTYTSQPISTRVSDAFTCSDDSEIDFPKPTEQAFFILRCVPGEGNGCWPGYRPG